MRGSRKGPAVGRPRDNREPRADRKSWDAGLHELPSGPGVAWFLASVRSWRGGIGTEGGERMGRIGCRLEGSYDLSWKKRQKRKVVHRGKGGKRQWCRGHILFGE